MSHVRSSRGRRPTGPPTRAPRSRREWVDAVYASDLIPVAISVVLLVGEYMTWPERGGGRNAYPGVEELERRFAGKLKRRAIVEHLSTGTQEGVLIITAASSPGRATVYAAGVPTGEPGLSELPLAVENPVTRAPDCMCTSVHTCASAQSHMRQNAASRAPDCTPPPHDHLGTTSTPPPPIVHRSPLLGAVDGGRRTGEPSTSRPPPLRHAPTYDDGMRAAALVVGRLPLPLRERVKPAKIKFLGRQLVPLLGAGWTPLDLVNAITGPSWAGVVSPGAVLVSRAEQLLALTPPQRSDTPSSQIGSSSG